MARTKEAARKRKSSEYDSDDGFVEGTSAGPQAKRTKSQSTGLQPQTDSDGNKFWEISRMRRVTVSDYKGKQMVGLREYYEQGGEIKPGKKGISMPMDQFSAFIEILPQIEKELVKKGEQIPRPQYDKQATKNDGMKEEQEEEEDDDDDDEEDEPKKANIEATSDEDED